MSTTKSRDLLLKDQWVLKNKTSLALGNWPNLNSVGLGKKFEVFLAAL